MLKIFAKAYFANIVEPISVISDLGPITLYQIFVLVLEVLNATWMNFEISMRLEQLLKFIVFWKLLKFSFNYPSNMQCCFTECKIHSHSIGHISIFEFHVSYFFKGNTAVGPSKAPSLISFLSPARMLILVIMY